MTDTKAESALALPAVHMNGTGGQELLDQLRNALDSLRNSVETMQQASPNGRDYYVVSMDAFHAAQKQHEKRLHKIADVIHELQIIAESVSDQIDARNARKG